MPEYSILIKPSAVKEIESISSKRDRQAIVSLTEKLADNPRPAGRERLSGHDKYSVRRGRPGIIRSVEDQELVVWS